MSSVYISSLVMMSEQYLFVGDEWKLIEMPAKVKMLQHHLRVKYARTQITSMVLLLYLLFRKRNTITYLF